MAAVACLGGGYTSPHPGKERKQTFLKRSSNGRFQPIPLRLLHCPARVSWAMHFFTLVYQNLNLILYLDSKLEKGGLVLMFELVLRRQILTMRRRSWMHCAVRCRPGQTSLKEWAYWYILQINVRSV